MRRPAITRPLSQRAFTPTSSEPAWRGKASATCRASGPRGGRIRSSCERRRSRRSPTARSAHGALDAGGGSFTAADAQRGDAVFQIPRFPAHAVASRSIAHRDCNGMLPAFRQGAQPDGPPERWRKLKPARAHLAEPTDRVIDAVIDGRRHASTARKGAPTESLRGTRSFVTATSDGLAPMIPCLLQRAHCGTDPVLVYFRTDGATALGTQRRKIIASGISTT
jgi:hypothetical protein